MPADPETTSYREVRLPAPPHPLQAITTLAASGLFDQYVAYESRADWSFAGGRLADLQVSRTGAVLRQGTDSTALPHTEDLPATVHRFLTTLPVPHWRAYGWAAFELAYLHSDLAHLAGDQVLLHLLVPHTEVRITTQDMLLRSTEEAVLDQVAALLQHPPRSRTPAAPAWTFRSRTPATTAPPSPRPSPRSAPATSRRSSCPASWPSQNQWT